MGLEIVISVTLLLLGIAVLVMIHVCIVSRAFRTTSNTNMPMVLVQRNRRSPSMSQDEIKNLPCFDYCVRVDDQEKESISGSRTTFECVVCLESFKEGQKCRLLPKCSHCFHAECIDSWLETTGACPICRTGALTSPNTDGENSTGQP